MLRIGIKIQSISDIITNSSTEVFMLYSIRNIQVIKNIVNAILAIDNNYTFDDLFNIHMTIDEDVIDSIYESYEEVQKEYKSIDDFINYIHQASEDELYDLEDTYEDYNIFDGYKVSIKEGVENTKVLQKAKTLLNTLDNIFDITYSCDW